MNVTDAHLIANEIYHEITGKSPIDTIDTSAIIDIGRELKSVSSTDVVYGAIADRIGKMVVRNKNYNGKFLNILRDAWEFGNILQTLRVKTIEAETDHSYNPQEGQVYDSFTRFKKMNVVQKFYQDFDNFQITYWRPTDQLWSAFNSSEELTRFMSGVETAVQISMSGRLQGLAKLAITNMIAQTLNKDFPDGDFGSDSKLRSVNLLHLYNAQVETGSELTAENCRQSSDFLRFAAKTMNNVYDRLQDISVLYNIDGEEEFSNADDIQITMLSTFANDLKYNLYNAVGQFDYSLMTLPGYDTVPYWQGNGQDYEEGHIAEIHQTIKIKDEEGEDTTSTVEATGILAIMYDKEAVAINCEHRTAEAFRNPDIAQTKFYNRFMAQYLNAFDKNFVVFYVADAE